MSATLSQRPLLRWSSTRDCGRKAIYEATGAPARDRTDREKRILFRGQRIGRDYAELLSINHNTRDDHRKFIRARVRAEEQPGSFYYGAGKVWAEKKVVWPLGVGHVDVWLPETATVVEILSSAHATPTGAHSKKLQLVGYMEHDPEARNGALVVLDPADMSEDRELVSKHDGSYKALVEEMHDRIRQVQTWDATGEMPARVCAKPSDARGHFCVYADHCFQDWTAPELPRVETPEIAELARQFYEVDRLAYLHNGGKQDVAAFRAVLDEQGVDSAISWLRENRVGKGIDELAQTLKARLGEAVGTAPEDFLRDPGSYNVGALTLTRTHVVRAAYEAKASEYDKWSVRRNEDGPLPAATDFGDEAPF